MKLWGRRSSFNVQKVAWLVAELGLQVEHIELGGRFGGLETEAFKAINPHAKVPVIEDDSLVVWESHTILRYLAAAYGGNAWWPDHPADRSHLDRWLDWTATRLQPDFMALFWGFYRAPQAARDMAAVDNARRACAADYALLDAQLARRPFLAGEHLTLADLPAGATLYRYLTMGLDVPRPPHLLAWYDRLQQRPAYRAQIMVPFDELFARASY